MFEKQLIVQLVFELHEGNAPKSLRKQTVNVLCKCFSWFVKVGLVPPKWENVTEFFSKISKELYF